MANYLFERITDAQAAAFSTSDSLFFLDGGVQDLDVRFNQGGGLNNASITITKDDVSRTFLASAFSNETLTFFGQNAGAAAFGSNDAATPDTAATSTFATDATTGAYAAGTGNLYFGLAGNDTITATNSLASDTLWGGDGNDAIIGTTSTATGRNLATEADYLMGGAGNDTITGGSGNDHIYGNAVTTTAGAVDGDDSINAGAGNDYVQGNAGNDIINGEAGNDRLYGGQGNDVIDGGAGADYLQGNRGTDSLTGGLGDDTVRGGADNDTLVGSEGNDMLFGDAGNDSLTGGAGFDTLSGGAGNDIFVFAVDDAASSNLNAAPGSANFGLVDTIADFAANADTIDLGATAVSLIVGTTTSASATDGLAYAQGLLSQANSTNNVAAVQVGTDTYLFYNDGLTAGSTIDSAIKLTGVTAANLDNADFV
ncbi:calcium-binding protein [uncultured Sphingomonas sp.]|uniref:calcium-binding protein n=1 Tax=uncultured Sphingomonas sp. TaxID=158754 RepID=UPI0025F28E74|nr:calcium-binding protein [uncultured Sphingomonas sp.]